MREFLIHTHATNIGITKKNINTPKGGGFLTLTKMKTTKSFIIGLLLLFTSSILAQDCVDYHIHSGCNLDLQRGYKIYSQSKSTVITSKDTIEFNMVFYGLKDYVFSFCTQQEFYPIHYCLIDPDTREVLYDNANDRYIESLEVGFDNAKSLAIQINVRATNLKPVELQSDVGCIGLLIQYKNYPKVK